MGSFSAYPLLTFSRDVWFQFQEVKRLKVLVCFLAGINFDSDFWNSWKVLSSKVARSWHCPSLISLKRVENRSFTTNCDLVVSSVLLKLELENGEAQGSCLQEKERR